MSKIKQLHAREILDSRGNPTIELEMILDNGTKAWSSVPSGASTGLHEAYELRDYGNRLNGKGVRKAIQNIHALIAPAIIGMSPTDQSAIDGKMIELDGTPNKSKLGANAILAVSMCVVRLGSREKEVKLYEYISSLSGNTPKIPRPFFNVINGGMHAGNSLPFQEFMISPKTDMPADGHGNFADTYFSAAEIYNTLKKNLKNKFGGGATLLGDEGGFAPDNISDIYEVLDILMTAISDSGYEDEVDIALDVAASEFYDDGIYNLGFKTDTPNNKTAIEMIDIYKDICNKYPIISIEDPFDQDDFGAFADLLLALNDKEYSLTGKNIHVVGDDLTVTNPKRIEKAIQQKSCDSLLLKLNQIGTITESIEAFKLAKSHGWTVMVSHRSGETTDDFIADFAVGIGAEYVKFGSVARGERVVKYNRLLAISENI